MGGGDGKRPNWLRYSTIGVEFAAAVAGFTLVGFWVDRSYDCSPWGVLIGAVLGLIGGMYNLIRESLIATRIAKRPSDEDGTRHDPSKRLGED